MRTRHRSLPTGWYPSQAGEVKAAIAGWGLDFAGQGRGQGAGKVLPGAIAAIAPHAGWAFSGRLAALAISSLADAETVAVIGGHLPGGYPVVMGREEVYETPGGLLEQDIELASALGRLLPLEGDGAEDNTVEVQLPLLQSLKPGVRMLWLRAPAGAKAMELGACLDSAARALGRSLVCLGSTDLTHYGPDYGFEPAGRGSEAEKWLREVSDRGFIEALLALDAEASLARGGAGAACSSGAAAAALTFALAQGATKAELLGYGTSLEVRKAASFVGYAALGFYRT